MASLKQNMARLRVFLLLLFLSESVNCGADLDNVRF